MARPSPAGYHDAYWADVAGVLTAEYGATPQQAAAAAAAFRARMRPAGETIYNDDPADTAAVIARHGLVPGAVAGGVVLDLVFELADRARAVRPDRLARAAQGLIDALSKYERALGGRGLRVTDRRAEPGRVVLTLEPAAAAGAADRLRRVAEAVAGKQTEAARAGLPDVDAVRGVVRLAA